VSPFTLWTLYAESNQGGAFSFSPPSLFSLFSCFIADGDGYFSPTLLSYTIEATFLEL
jgi:hypothetical protein